MTMSQLPAHLLERRHSLPLKPAPATLSGRFVRLEPLTFDHAPALFAHANGSPIELAGRTCAAYNADELIWRYLFAGPFADLASFERYIAETIAGADRLALCVIDQASGQPAGVVTLMSNVPAHLRIELGGIWYSPIVQRTQANLESTYLMLRHCLELGYRRVEWKCDSRNERSRRAALRMGFTFEGIQEYHMIVKGQSRDTAWFRLLDHEWPTVRARQEAMLYGGC
jgi:RimJ/RimL family protein N-acetyltransferase